MSVSFQGDPSVHVGADGTERGSPSADFSALHLQLLNQVMLCNAHATPFVGLSAAACLEEVYHTDSVGASSAAGLIRGWPTHVARMSRDLLVSNIGRSHSEQNPRSFAGQSVAEDIEAKELAATSGERSKEVDKSVADPIRGMTAEDGQFELREMALARVLGAVINRWPAIAPELLTPADCVATLRYIAKHNADPLRQTSFVNLVAAFAEQQLVPPAEQQECRACLCTVHSSKERRRPLFWQPFSAVAEPAPGLLVPLSGILASRRRKPRKNEKKRGKNGRDMA